MDRARDRAVSYTHLDVYKRQVYAFALLLFNILGFLAVYAIQRFQASLPLNPMAMPAVSPDSSFNTCLLYTSRCV